MNNKSAVVLMVLTFLNLFSVFGKESFETESVKDESYKIQGVSFNALYSGEYADVFSGGAVDKTGSLYHDNLDLTLTLDTSKSGLWEGGTFWIYGLRNSGDNPSDEFSGDIQGASNISAPRQFIVNEAWYNQDFKDGSISLLAGLHNLNSEFYVSTLGTLFINSSFGIGPELSGNVPVSIFPQCGLAVRLRVKPSDNTYVQTAIYDGDPSTREVHSSEGNLALMESGYEINGSDYKIGYWRHSAEKEYGDKTYDSDFGIYGILDQKILALNNNENSSLGAFLVCGWVPSERNEITGYLGTGLNTHGILPGRSEDDLGFGIAMAKTHEDTETAYELAYRFIASSWLSIRPSLQYIKNPGGSKANDSATIGFLRVESGF